MYTHHALFCFILFCYSSFLLVDIIHPPHWLNDHDFQSISPISFRVASLALGQSYDCPSAIAVTLNDMSKLPTKTHKEL